MPTKKWQREVFSCLRWAISREGARATGQGCRESFPGVLPIVGCSSHPSNVNSNWKRYVEKDNLKPSRARAVVEGELMRRSVRVGVQSHGGGVQVWG